MAGDLTTQRWRPTDLALFGLITLLFGGAFPAIKAGLDYFPPLLFAAVRYGLSATLLLGYAVATGHEWLPRERGDRIAVLAGGVFFIGATGLTFVGQQFTTSGVAAIIFGLVPVLTVVLAAWLLPTEHLSRLGLVGVIVGLVGVAIVVQPDPANLLGPTVVGNGLILIAASGVALGTVLVRRSHATMSIVALTGWAMVVGATIQVVLSVATGESFADVRITPTAILVVAYLAIFASAIGFVVYFTLIERFGPLEVNLVTYLNPVVAVIVGWLLLGEPILPSAIVGFGVILFGFVLLREKELAAELAKFRGAGR